MTGDKPTSDVRLSTSNDEGKRIKDKHLHWKSGYSLAELLVVAALFSLAVLILSQTYIQFIRLSRKTSNAAAVQQDTRYVLEYVARLARTYEVDYTVPVLAATSSLRMTKTGADYVMIKKSAAGDPLCADEPAVSCLLVTVDSGANWAPLTGKHVNVDEFMVYVQPTVSPFILSGSPVNYNNDQQPLVAVQLQFTYKTPNERESFTQSAQTTVSTRTYAR
ncbi:MAG: PilW family protein [Patescibacteria group bacterium]